MSLDDYEYEDAMSDFVEKTLKDTSMDNSRWYLGTYGDAVEARVVNSLEIAEELVSSGHFGPSLVLATTAIELMIRFMLVRPIVQGAFLSDEWSEILANRVGSGRTDEDRKLLPKLLLQWGVDIDTVKNNNGKAVWELITTKIIPKRNKVVHTGETATQHESELSIESAKLIHTEIVHVIARKLGFTLEDTGLWCKIHGKENDSGREWWSSFKPQSPFEDTKL